MFIHSRVGRGLVQPLRIGYPFVSCSGSNSDSEKAMSHDLHEEDAEVADNRLLMKALRSASVSVSNATTGDWPRHHSAKACHRTVYALIDEGSVSLRATEVR